MELKRITFTNNDAIVILFENGKEYKAFLECISYECGFSDTSSSSAFLSRSSDNPEELFDKVWSVIEDSIYAKKLSYFEISISRFHEVERKLYREALNGLREYHITEHDAGFYANRY